MVFTICPSPLRFGKSAMDFRPKTKDVFLLQYQSETKNIANYISQQADFGTFNFVAQHPLFLDDDFIISLLG